MYKNYFSIRQNKTFILNLNSFKIQFKKHTLQNDYNTAKRMINNPINKIYEKQILHCLS